MVLGLVPRLAGVGKADCRAAHIISDWPNPYRATASFGRNPMTPEAMERAKVVALTRRDHRAPWAENPFGKLGLAVLWHRLHRDHMENDNA